MLQSMYLDAYPKVWKVVSALIKLSTMGESYINQIITQMNMLIHIQQILLERKKSIKKESDLN